MAWKEEIDKPGFKTHYDSLVKARAAAVKDLENKPNFTRVHIYRTATSRSESNYVQKEPKDTYTWNDYKPHKYGAGHFAMYKNGKLYR